MELLPLVQQMAATQPNMVKHQFFSKNSLNPVFCFGIRHRLVHSVGCILYQKAAHDDSLVQVHVCIHSETRPFCYVLRFGVCTVLYSSAVQRKGAGGLGVHLERKKHAC